MIAALSFVSATAITTLESAANAQAETGAAAPSAFSFEPPPAPRSPIRMIVNLHTQRGYVYRDGELIRSTPISSGKRGHRTPTGTFTVLEKQRVHHSNRYDNAPMPYMQRLTWNGVALHGGHVPGYPASHGCVRLPIGFARWLFSEPTMGMTVVITDQRSSEKPTQISSNIDGPLTTGSSEEPDDSQ